MMTSTLCSDSSQSPTEENKEERPWSDLPLEILEMIKMNLSLPEHHNNFSSVCQQWHKIPTHVYPADNCPLLVYYEKAECGVCNYYSPALHKTFVVPCPIDLSDTTFHHAVDDWLLLSRGRYEMFLVNPFTGVFHEIEELESSIDMSAMAFSAPPVCPSSSSINPDCILFGIRVIAHVLVNIKTCRGLANWSADLDFHNNRPFQLADTNPVYHRGLFYCLGLDGTLGTFDPTTNEWNVLSKPRPVVLPTAIGQGHLIKSKEKLFSVFIERQSMDFNVFRLNEVLMQWKRVRKLEYNCAFFVGHPKSLLVPSTTFMSNKVFFPRIHGKPEKIPAEVKLSEGRLFFVSKSSLWAEDKKSLDRDKEGMCYYDLVNGDKYNFYKSFNYLFSIWYTARSEVI